MNFFHTRFKRLPRGDREQLLCSMIRVNYGTPWEGDLLRLKSFFPEEYHKELHFGGLLELIEALNPFADEPTDYSVVAHSSDLKEGDVTYPRFYGLDKEVTSSLPEVTTDVPIHFAETITTKLPVS